MLGSLLVGLYAWIVTIFAGAVLLDVVYSRLLRDSLGTSAMVTAFSGVSDFLLYIGFVAVLSALGAIGSSLKSGAARYLFIGSLAVLLVEFLPPAFLPGVVFNAGYWFRIIVTASASILAFIGLFEFRRPR